MTDIICAVCGKNQQTRVFYPANFREKDFSPYTYSARRPPDRIHYQILKCENCKLIFSSPILSYPEIVKLYKESSCFYEEQIPYVANTYLDIFEEIRKFMPKKPKILDIGCGNGFFLNALVKTGIKDVYGVEPSLKIAKQAPEKFRKNIKVDIFKPGQFPKNYFNAVCCFHVLDHVVGPNKFINLTLDILSPGGYAIFVVHNVDSLLAKLFGEKWPIFDIEHIYLFNKTTLNLLFLKHKFRKIKTFNVGNTYPLSYFVKMAPVPKRIKDLLQVGLKKLKISNLAVPLRGGNIGIIAQK